MFYEIYIEYTYVSTIQFLKQSFRRLAIFDKKIFVIIIIVEDFEDTALLDVGMCQVLLCGHLERARGNCSYLLSLIKFNRRILQSRSSGVPRDSMCRAICRRLYRECEHNRQI